MVWQDFGYWNKCNKTDFIGVLSHIAYDPQTYFFTKKKPTNFEFKLGLEPPLNDSTPVGALGEGFISIKIDFRESTVYFQEDCQKSKI